MLTLTEAAQRAGLSRTALLFHVLRGRLRATKVGRQWIVLEADLERFQELWQNKKRLRVKA